MKREFTLSSDDYKRFEEFIEKIDEEIDLAYDEYYRIKTAYRKGECDLWEVVIANEKAKAAENSLTKAFEIFETMKDNYLEKNNLEMINGCIISKEEYNKIIDTLD